VPSLLWPAQIDENLIRNELSALEHCEETEHRKRVYEAIHPQTKQGGAPGAGQGRGKVCKTAESATLQPTFKSVEFDPRPTAKPVPSFVADTAAKTHVAPSA
jgi:ParB family transcriptional regulator, chromosome partitioning protein